MTGNSFGQCFKITTFGESHGPGIGVVLDGVPAGLALTEADIQRELDRRKPGQSAMTTPRNEPDTVEFLSGVFDGKTTGASLALLIRNTNQRSGDYDNLKDVYRPGHADWTYDLKYGVGIRDHRGSGRASGRETAARVAAGAIAKKILKARGIEIHAGVVALGGITAVARRFDLIETNPIRCTDPEVVAAMVARVEAAREAKDSIGGIVEAQILGCPGGLGEPVFDKLDAQIGHALLSLGAVKGIEFGAGFALTNMMGSGSNDTIVNENGNYHTLHNHAGGILGGISTGEPIIVRVAVKPTSSIEHPQTTIDRHGNPVTIEVKGRHDPTICPRIVPVVESMLAIVILDNLMRQSATQF